MNLWNMRSLGKNKLIRNMVKYFFSVYFKDGRIITIGRGPLKGYKWLCSKDHQFWMPLGLYEFETANWIAKQIKEGDTFIDMGANAGYFTLLGSKCVGKNGTTIAFEPIPHNINVIKTHLNNNNISNTIVEQKAISNTNGVVNFTIEKNNANSHISNIEITHAKMLTNEIVEVETTTLDDYIKNNNYEPNVIKIDVEGAEMDVLTGAQSTLEEFKPVCIVSTHSKELLANCRKFFEKNNYLVEDLQGFHHELCCYPK